MLDTGHLHERKIFIYARIWGLKRKGGGGGVPQGEIFSGTYGTTFANGTLHQNQLILYGHQTVWLPTLVAITTQHVHRCTKLTGSLHW